MRSLTFSFVLVLVAIAMASAAGDKPHYDVSNAHNLFEAFIAKYERHYKDDADKEVHFKAFVENLGKINKMNTEQSTATFDINKFADYTEEERQSMFGLKRKNN